jgi:hypothetical protein
MGRVELANVRELSKVPSAWESSAQAQLSF